MELIIFAVVIAAIWMGYKIGQKSGRAELIEDQAQHIRAALYNDSEFRRKTGIHGTYYLTGHEFNTQIDFVIVNSTELDSALQRDTVEDEFQSAEEVLHMQILDQEKPLKPSAELASIVGDKPIAKSEAIKLVWKYIEEHSLQDVEKRTQIACDECLRKITGQEKCSMFQRTKHINENLQ